MARITLEHGNPVQDKKESIERFKTIINPLLSVRGFVQPKKNSHLMISDKSKTLIIAKSCPSQTTHVKAFKTIVADLRKKYEGYSIYIVFHRDTNEWYDKPVYMSTLRYIMDNKSLKGVICGIDNFIKQLNNLEQNKFIIAT